MRPITLALSALLAALAWAQAAAQGYIHEGGGQKRSAAASDDSSSPSPAPAASDDSSPDQEAPPPAPKPRPKRRGHKAAPKVEEESSDDEDAAPPRRRRSSDPKGAVEEYLRSRLAAADKNHREQKTFGDKMSARWLKFFDGMYDDRKRFEASIARQRLNLFDTMASVGPDYRSQAVKDFEQMQSTMLKSFDSSQRQRMDEFFGRLVEDVKAYEADQDRKRAAMVAASEDAWKDEKALLDEGGKKSKERD